MTNKQELRRQVDIYIRQSGERGSAVDIMLNLLKVIDADDSHLAKENERLKAEIAELVGALEPFAKLELPKKPEGNAGMWSLLHKDIRIAKEALNQTPESRRAR